MMVDKRQTCRQMRSEDEEGLPEDAVREKQGEGQPAAGGSAVFKVVHLKLFICGAFCQISLSLKRRPNEDAD